MSGNRLVSKMTKKSEISKIVRKTITIVVVFQPIEEANGISQIVCVHFASFILFRHCFVGEMLAMALRFADLLAPLCADKVADGQKDEE